MTAPFAPPLRPGVLHHWTPASFAGVDPAPVFAIRPATFDDAADFDVQLELLGGRLWSEAVRLETMIDGLEAFARSSDADTASLDPLLALARDALASIRAGCRWPDTDPRWSDLARIEAGVRDLYPPFHELCRQTAVYLTQQPRLAAWMFCAGWEHVFDASGDPVPFARDLDGRVAKSALHRLPPGLLMALGYRCLALMRPDEAARKNSPAPSTLSGSPACSPEGAPAPTVAGASPGSSSTRTRASRRRPGRKR